ncbi:MAG: lanthionine synthetase C family protein [Holophagaceae bacterium]|nr:lanthionine synthetase C family protein [Holophagaceae bacterium]
MALFYGYLAQARPGHGWEDLSLGLLGRAVDGLREGVLKAGFFTGFTGVAWVVDHLQARLFGGEEDYNESIDAALLDHLARGPKPAVYDLVQGHVGLGVYGLGRLHRGRGAALVAKVLDRLEEASIETAEGIAWRTPHALLPDWQKERNPNGYYDLGVAHGIPGVMAFLGLACEAGVAPERARRLLEGAVSWLFNHQLPRAEEVRFARTISAEGVPEPTHSRVGWCYGDLGIAVALLGAARRAGRGDWETEALDMALAAAGRRREDCAVRDPALCHGALGAARLFDRLHRATGEERFREAASRWAGAAMDFWRPSGSGPEFHFEKPELRPGESPWTTDAGFLVGSAGVGLGLLSVLSPVAPAWDRILLMDLPEGDGA